MIDRDIVKQLAGREAADGLILSVFLSTSSLDDWRQTVPTFLNSEFRRLIREGSFSRGQIRSLEAGLQRLTDLLQYETDLSTEGLAVFAEKEDGFFESWQLPVRLKNRMVAEPAPYIRPLIHAVSLLEPFVVARISRDESTLTVVDEWRVSMGESFSGPYLKSTDRETGDVPVKEYYAAARQESLVEQHYKDVAAALEKLLKKKSMARVVLAGQHEILNNFRKVLSPDVKARVAAAVSWSPSLSEAQLAARAREALTGARREEKVALTQRIGEALGARGLGIAGLDETFVALQRGQVRTLVVDRAYRPNGWRCPGCGHAGASSVEICPVCGAQVSFCVDVAGEAMRRAILQGTYVEVGEDIPLLTELGGIAGLLRYG